MFPKTAADYLDVARQMVDAGWDGGRVLRAIETLLVAQGASLAVRSEVRRVVERMVGEAADEDEPPPEDDEVEEDEPPPEDNEVEEDEPPPDWVRGLLPEAWAGPGWVAAKHVGAATDIWEGLVASPWSRGEPGAVPPAVTHLLALATEGPAGEPPFTVADLAKAIDEARWWASQRRQRHSPRGGSIAPAAGDSAHAAKRKAAARARVAEYRRRVKAVVRGWLGEKACGECGKPNDKPLELNKKDGGGEQLRRTASGKRDSFGEWRYAYRLGPERCRREFNLLCRPCHVAVDRQRMRAGGRRSGEVRRQKRAQAEHLPLLWLTGAAQRLVAATVRLEHLYRTHASLRSRMTDEVVAPLRESLRRGTHVFALCTLARGGQPPGAQ